ncbi:hypothetical protein VNO80_28248 [Phaseolus coccineus]|uniref:Cation-transporting P-type ATPase C-terminal domain-containing protein n=1 Tax=Phaseolus coccineus TaxID=3886 RepID=A0AAN9QII5_PHACN
MVAAIILLMYEASKFAYLERHHLFRKKKKTLFVFVVRSVCRMEPRESVLQHHNSEASVLDVPLVIVLRTAFFMDDRVRRVWLFLYQGQYTTPGCSLGSLYANIQKFIQFQLTVNAAALVINVVAAISSAFVGQPYHGTLGALALATEPPTDSLMHRSPVGRREPLITNIMWRNLFVQALYQVIVLLILHFDGESILRNEDSTVHTIQEKNTLIFNAFVFSQIFNELNARKPE